MRMYVYGFILLLVFLYFSNILFHPSGSCLFAASANMLRVYGWEPTHCYDEIRTNWGNIASMCFTSTQLVS